MFIDIDIDNIDIDHKLQQGTHIQKTSRNHSEIIQRT